MITVRYGSGYNVLLDEIESMRLGKKYNVRDGQCYKDTVNVLLREGLDAEYIEGFVFDETGGSNHGWLEKDGIVIDPSYKESWGNDVFYIPHATYTRVQVDIRTDRKIKPPYSARDYHRENFFRGVKLVKERYPEGSDERRIMELVEKELL